MTRDELRDRVIEMWPDNPASAIGRALNLTRNAVIGIAYRERAKGKKVIKKTSGQNDRVAKRVPTCKIKPVVVKATPAVSRCRAWSDQEVSRLRQLINEKKRVEDIVYLLEDEFKAFRSESSIRSKMAKMGLKAPYNPNGAINFRSVSTPEQAEKAQATSQTRLARIEAETSENPKNIIDIGYRECRFPVGDTKPEQLFCADHTQHDSAYCTRHHDICKVKYVERSRRKA